MDWIDIEDDRQARATRRSEIGFCAVAALIIAAPGLDDIQDWWDGFNASHPDFLL